MFTSQWHMQDIALGRGSPEEERQAKTEGLNKTSIKNKHKNLDVLGKQPTWPSNWLFLPIFIFLYGYRKMADHHGESRLESSASPVHNLWRKKTMSWWAELAASPVFPIPCRHKVGVTQASGLFLPHLQTSCMRLGPIFIVISLYWAP